MEPLPNTNQGQILIALLIITGNIWERNALNWTFEFNLNRLEP